MSERRVNNPIRPGTRTPTCGCPYCGAVINAATEVDGKAVKPEAGDFTLCLYCGAFCVFKADGTLRRPVRSEERQAQRDPEIRRARETIAFHHMSQGASRLH